MIARIVNSGVIAVLRAPSGEALLDVAEALLAGGVEAIEVTFTVPKAHRVLEHVADRLGDKIVLGAGTVLDAQTARTALLAGAEFIVGPRRQPRHDPALPPLRQKPSCPAPSPRPKCSPPGKPAPTSSRSSPLMSTGPKYLKALRGPLPQVRMMPTGGVNLQTAADFLKAGACALGVGGALVEPKALADRNMQRIQSLAHQFVEIVKQTRLAQ